MIKSNAITCLIILYGVVRSTHIFKDKVTTFVLRESLLSETEHKIGVNN